MKQKPANFKKVKTTEKNKMTYQVKKQTRRKLKIKKSLKSSLQAKIMEQPPAEQKVYNDDFIKALSELENIMIRQGEPFRARAYHKAVETIMKFPMI